MQLHTLVFFLHLLATSLAMQTVGITYLDSAKSLGAVCLDGSVPAYHLSPGLTTNWHISLEGGGWCESQQACEIRAKTSLGSSTYMQTQVFFSGILSNSFQVNPDFHNWTHVFVRYCDGASFSADVDEPQKLSSGQVLYLRGKRILKAVIDDLKLKGLNQANQVLLSGCSAGGLAAIQHCNHLESYLPGAKLKCLSDGGFFLNVSDINGILATSNYYSAVTSFHNLQRMLDSSCTSSRTPSQCFFPENMQAYVKPPLFILNSAYDYWQLDHVKKLSREQYSSCMNYTSTKCSGLSIIQGFRKNMIQALSISKYRSSSGMFVDSCFTHCHGRTDSSWNNPKVNGKSAAQTIGDWYYNRSSKPEHRIDCAYPCNPTCLPIFD